MFDGNKPGEPFTGWRAEVLKKGVWLVGRALMGCIGWRCLDSPKVTKINVDYSKWLGPDWKPDFVGPPSTKISPHTGVVECFCHMLFQLPSHISKKENLNIPFIGN